MQAGLFFAGNGADPLLSRSGVYAQACLRIAEGTFSEKERGFLIEMAAGNALTVLQARLMQAPNLCRSLAGRSARNRGTAGQTARPFCFRAVGQTTPSRTPLYKSRSCSIARPPHRASRPSRRFCRQAPPSGSASIRSGTRRNWANLFLTVLVPGASKDPMRSWGNTLTNPVNCPDWRPSSRGIFLFQWPTSDFTVWRLGARAFPCRS